MMSSAQCLCARLAVGLLVPVALIAPAGADNVQGDLQGAPPTGIETIVVTAQKRAENVQDIPTTMSALSAEDLKTRGLNSIDDLARSLPSVNFGTFGYGTQISARGVGMNLIAGEGESSVAVQLDGISLSNTSMLELLQNDLDRVEFLLGPQGTLYGRNATAGVLNLITPEPPSTFDAGATVGGGNYGAFQANGHIGGPVMDGVTARLYVGTDEHGGYIDNLYNGQKIDNRHDIAVRLAVNADVSSKLSFETRFFYLKTLSAGPIYKPIDPENGLPPDTFSLAPWKIKADAAYRTTLELSGASVLATYLLGDEDKITSLSGYTIYNDTQIYDSDGSSLNLFHNIRPQHTDQFTEEVDYLHSSQNLQTVVGAFYMHETISDIGQVVYTPGLTPLIGLTSLSFSNKKLNYNGAIFADATYNITPDFKVFGGLRGILDHHEIKMTNSDNFGDTAIDLCTPADPTGNQSEDVSALTGRLGSQYNISASSNVFATFSRGYKSGGYNSAQCGNEFGPETLNAWEIGSKNVFFDGQVLLNASAFYYDFKGLQVEQVVGTEGLIDNVPKSRIYGADFQGEWQITDRIEADGNLSLLNARYVEFSYLDQLNPGAGPQNLAGKPLNRSPNWSANYGIQYVLPALGGNITFRTDLYSTASFTLLPTSSPDEIQRGYTTVAGSISYLSDDEKYRARVWVKNATNQAVLQGVFELALFNIGREGIYGDPATYGIQLTRNF